MKEVELLAPAGDFEKLRIAFLYGADAVYFGGKDYGMRANAQNFSVEEIEKAVILAHQLNKKVYVTVNIVFHDDDVPGLDEYLRNLYRINVDAIIISDPLVLLHVKKLELDLEMHLSTQASTLNHETVKFWLSEGITRIVLAREAHRDDIIRIKKETGIDIECFIHGAMCTSFSGRCVLSNYATNRDSNRGGCAQICRWLFNIEGKEQPKFSMTPKDLNMVPFIGDMIDSGVNSFKVEGRMRSIYYIATVIMVYRNLIDKICNNTITPAYTKYYLNILNRCANRESTPQFYDKLPGISEQYFTEREEISNQDFLGIVKAYDENTKLAIIEQRNFFKLGDVIEVMGPNREPVTMQITEIYDEKDEKIEVARHAQMTVKIRVEVPVYADEMLRVKTFDIYDYL